VLVRVLPPLLMLVALPPFVADAVPPELPVEDAESLVVVVLVLVLYDPLTLTLPPLLAAFPPAPVAEAVLVLILLTVVVFVLVLNEPVVLIEFFPPLVALALRAVQRYGMTRSLSRLSTPARAAR